MKLALVEWEDSSGISGWHQLNPNYDCVSKCVTVGILCRTDKKQVVLSLNKADSGNYGDTIAIPRSCISKISYLKVK